MPLIRAENAWGLTPGTASFIHTCSEVGCVVLYTGSPDRSRLLKYSARKPCSALPRARRNQGRVQARGEFMVGAAQGIPHLDFFSQLGGDPLVRSDRIVGIDLGAAAAHDRRRARIGANQGNLLQFLRVKGQQT